MAYQPRRSLGADMASSDGRPSHDPPSASPWPTRRISKATMAAVPASL